MTKKSLRVIAIFAALLALCVVMLGAYTRLTDAGLGCPDWPGCYGQMVLSAKHHVLQEAQQHYPQQPIEPRKAWTEMAHRYIAGILVLLVLYIAIYAWWSRKRLPRLLPSVLVGLIAFQATLGMWTVTWKLLPVVVMGHLLGGILIFTGLTYYGWQLSGYHGLSLSGWHRLLGIGLCLVFLQIALGGWVSSNYAGIACVGFPQCNGQWLPELAWRHSFNIFNSIGANYQGGLLDNAARVTIQFVHRIGAVVVAGYVSVVVGILCVRYRQLRYLASFILMLVVCQFALGVANVVWLLPLPIAVAHNGVAALLLASLAGLFYLTRGATHEH